VQQSEIRLGGIRCMAFHPDGKTLACGGMSGIGSIGDGIGTPTIVLFDADHAAVENAMRAMRASLPCQLGDAIDGVSLEVGKVWLAHDPNRHVIIEPGEPARLRLVERDPINGCRPSADLLFGSLARSGLPALGGLLTGSGTDGVRGLAILAEAKGRVFVQRPADYAPRDWSRAYALMTLANGAGLPQARDALGQMDKFIPQAQRAQAQSLARELEAGARAQRSAELGAAELAMRPPVVAAVSQPAPGLIAAPMAARKSSSRPAAAVPIATVASGPALARGPAAVTPVPRQGSWRVQLGAFGVPANAERLWSQLSGNAALEGTRKTLLPSGKLTRLLASGFASESAASRACTALKREGQGCVVAGQG
jgi:cell division septation protein DedD